MSEQIFMFCGSPDCICEDICCQTCEKRSGCENRCDNVRFKEQIYSDPLYLAEHLEEKSKEKDDWILAVAGRIIKDLQTGYVALLKELEALRVVRDAAEELNFWNAGFGHSETHTELGCKLADALAAAKGVD